MKTLIMSLIAVASFQFSFAQENKSTTVAPTHSAIEQEVIQLSKQKWEWMADKNITKLEPLFDNKSKFVHMSGTWKKDEELDIIKTGRIWYKNAKIHDLAIETFGKTAILWNRITLEAIVRGSEVVTEFTVTETYQKQGKDWKLLALTFSSVRDKHQIQK
ncbi:nuclear transport factor 2 family protein [Flavobacterium sp. ZE23DGlu08]|uniref:nuclear transport factor 2 family protein n=1 Tax=Flavobacterium sp. ZE23DGlu08 TaxID=3059026 RepID=UPI0026601CF1|nr:nuclear transport factor 2 family protein [Flavobacterium sp. ZE23DGlu08]WKL45192.1 nuclear transport factor 2 family protein [Flavobacterium sp. ZE23DGlu08]